MPLVPRVAIDAYRRLLLKDKLVRDPSTTTDWMDALDAGIAALATTVATSVVTTQVSAALPRASVARTGAFPLATDDRGAVDEGSGTFTVTVPAAATLGDPWTYDMIVASGTVTFAGASSSVPVSASGGGTPVRVCVANGKVLLRSGSSATVTRVA